MTDPENQDYQKSSKSMSTAELVRKILGSTAEAKEWTRAAIESSRWRLRTRELDLDTEPTGDRIRESF